MEAHRRVRVLAAHASAQVQPQACVGAVAPAQTRAPLSGAWYSSGTPGSAEPSAPVITSSLQKDATYQKRYKHSSELLKQLHEGLEWSKQGGGGKYVELHRSRGKLLPRERIARVVDPGTELMELCPLAGLGKYKGEVPSGGLVAGVGVVHGRECIFICNDATVKGGAFFPEGGAKQGRAQQIAAENHLPCIYFVDGGGAKLDAKTGDGQKTATSSDGVPTVSFVMGGAAFKNQAVMSSKRIPQVALICGMCTAGAAYIPAMCDESVIVKNNGTVYLGGPPLVKAATGEDADEQELGGGIMHTTVSGVVDHLAETEAEGLVKVRAILEHLAGRRPKETLVGMAAPEMPMFDADELLGLVPEDPAVPMNMFEVIARIVDGSRFHEFKPHYDSALICGFAHLDGYPVGIVTSNGRLSRKSAIKAAHFVQICGQRFIPLVFLHNAEGFTYDMEQQQAGIVKDVGKMIAAISCVPVPKFCVICGSSIGDSGMAMGGKDLDPSFMWLWPNARLSHKRSAFASTSAAYDDGIIDPRETRMTISRCISVSLNAPRADG
eukprot:CAMPEP_0168402296 /NCGR_PEP_ID=MMETSP0228-20121227/23547_1 /TAXON_ID=133427 /ORGANISM="Protoceratium reticulatum, Strain CCCM 535 (=CCMP 1889)" /LENGTH=550 /DNA_ID=CAMNT_0008415877 /DNA_START=71 /DNA_END=1720 /DNA_ORIENTATION=-